ncbi:MAG: hypothetical protein WCA35_03235 [Kovacikia sp.]
MMQSESPSGELQAVRPLNPGRLYFACNHIIRDDEIYENMSSVKFASLLDANART